MQNRSNLWKELAASSSSQLQTVAEIGGVTYSAISAPIINRSLMTAPLSIGNATSASLQFSVLTDETIPEAADVKIKMRFTDGRRYSEWLPAGTFFVANRKEDGVVRKLTTFSCFDALRKADGSPWTDSFWDYIETQRKIPMRDIIQDIAWNIGVEIDERTLPYIRDGPSYTCELPKLIQEFIPFIDGGSQGTEARQYLQNKGETKRKILAYIGGCLGGNWYITPENKLRFVPILHSPDADTADDPLNIVAITGSIKMGKSVTISGVSISNYTTTYTAGDDSGYVLTIPRNPYATQTIANDLFAQLGGKTYAPYIIEKGLYDPAAELGDYVVSRNDVRSVLYSETARLNLAFRGDISAPFREEVSDEYPYQSETAQLLGDVNDLVEMVADKATVNDLTAVQAQIENLSVSDIKTGIIHSNDYQYAPFPLLYPSATTYPSATSYPSNGEFVLRGFAIDFSTGAIYGAFYSEQIYTLQEITSEHAEQLLAHIQDYTNPHRVTAAQVGALPAGTFIPSKTSDLTNDSTFQTAANVDSKIDVKISGVYRASGQATLATLPALTAANLGRVYDMSADFTTTTNFVEGAGKAFPAGTNVAVVSVGNAYKYDVLAGTIDLSAIYSRIAALETEVTKLKNSLTYPKA